MIFLVRHGRAVFHQTCVRQLDGHWLETAGNRLIGPPAPCLALLTVCSPFSRARLAWLAWGISPL